METAVDGGYVVITVGQFAGVCAARKAGLITFTALRTWLAAHEQRAKRCTAKGRIRYTIAELARLVRTSEDSVGCAVRSLTQQGLLCWNPDSISFPSDVPDFAMDFAAELGTSPKRPVPVPRYVLRGIFRHKRPSEVMAALGHIIRCLFRRGHQIFNHGLIKATWVASVFGVAERSVHSARRWLLDQGFLIQEYVNQFVLNRWGGKFLVNLKQVRGALAAKKPRADFAPPTIKIKTSTRLNISYNHKNYKPAFGRPAAGVPRELEEPNLKNIQPEDLRKVSRLEKLYTQAVAARWLKPNEGNYRNFVCAAYRATRAGGRVGAIFVGIVRRHLWHHITQEQENHALGVLRRYRQRVSSNGLTLNQPVTAGPSSVKELVGTVLNCAGLLNPVETA